MEYEKLKIVMDLGILASPLTPIKFTWIIINSFFKYSLSIVPLFNSLNNS